MERHEEIEWLIYEFSAMFWFNKKLLYVLNKVMKLPLCKEFENILRELMSGKLKQWIFKII